LISVDECGVVRTFQQQSPANKHRQSYPQTFARAMVYFICKRIQFFPTLNRQIRSHGQSLPHQAMHVLFRAPLPRAIESHNRIDQITLAFVHGLGVEAVVDGFVSHAVFMSLGGNG
jgi:hypothetical protein